MAVFVWFDSFVDKLGTGAVDLNSDVLKIALSNTAPNAATNDELADITQIANGNGYTTGGETVANTAYSQTGGTGTLTGDDVTWSATGDMGPLRYPVLYDDTATGDPLIGYWDYGSSITPVDGDTFTVEFGASILTIASV